MFYALWLLCLLLPNIGVSKEEKPDAFIPSIPEQLAHQDSLVGNVIGPLSGHPILKQTDLHVNGAEPISLDRFYIPPRVRYSYYQAGGDGDRHHFLMAMGEEYRGWVFVPQLRLQVLNNGNFRVADSNGATLDYRVHNGQTTLVTDITGISNYAGGTPSGQYDPRNTRIAIDGSRVIVTSPTSVIRTYRQDFPFYLLEKEQLSNGKILRYEAYSGLKPQISKIQSLDPNEQHVYATISMSGLPAEGRCDFKTSTGQAATYHYYTHYVWNKWDERKGRDRFHSLDATPPFLTAVHRPLFEPETITYNNRLLIDTYCAKNMGCQCQYGYGKRGFFESGEHLIVEGLSLANDSNSDRQSTYRLSYDIPIANHCGGATTVENNDQTRTVYHYTKSFLPEKIQFFNERNELVKQSLYHWTKDQRLSALEWTDKDSKPLCRRSYEYDHFGNPIVETLAGDLSGNGTTDQYVTLRQFSDEGRHLLLREENGTGKVIAFQYVPNTNLPTRKYTYDGAHLVSREFWEYDAALNLIRKIVDDGSSEDKENLAGVATRTLTSYQRRHEQPFLHMPEWKEESYWESGTTHLLQRTHFLYDPFGNVREEAVYDADGKYAYSTHRVYNVAGQLLSETNALGQTTTYTYDGQGRCITSWDAARELKKEWEYDVRGRWRLERENGPQGQEHVRRRNYDLNDRLIDESDCFGNITRYTYDLVHNKVAATEHPRRLALDGSIVSVVSRSTYDAFGRKTTDVDANGNITSYQSNAYGSPTRITYADGNRETFRYTLSGKVQNHVDLAGLTTVYEYDGLERVIAKRYSSTHQDLGEEHFVYQGRNLVNESDRAGNITHYGYDGTGRKISEEFAGHTTRYAYDSLGRISTITKQNGENTLVTSFTRDLFGRVLTMTKGGQDGLTLFRIQHTYDAAGNQATTTHFRDGQPAVESKRYDVFDRCIAQTDPLGNVTTTLYDETRSNALGQRTLMTLTTDPQGVITAVSHDESGQPIKNEVRSPTQGIIACQEMGYDAAGNVIERREHIYHLGAYQKTQRVTYAINSQQRVSRMTREPDSLYTRTTWLNYTPSGEVANKHVPSGVVLNYRYDAWGHLTSLTSSDRILSLSYSYDRLGRLVRAVDERQSLAIDRALDAHGNVLNERFPSGLTVSKTYDELNRPLSLQWSDDAPILYDYDPLNLVRVRRGDRYVHHYTTYDLDGNLLAETPITGHQSITHHFDLKGRRSSIATDAFTQQCEYDSVDNLVHTTTSMTNESCQYEYDALGQLQAEHTPAASHRYLHDSHYNRVLTDNVATDVNPLNELLQSGSCTCTYDMNGNIVTKQTPTQSWHFEYDPLNQLTRATSETQRVDFSYDALGRRLSKVVHTSNIETDRQTYLYDGENEIAAFSADGLLKQLRVLGLAKHKNLPATVAIELDGELFAPFLDCQGNIRQLRSALGGAIFESYEFDAFGKQVGDATAHRNPWRYASKRFDSETQLIYFGKRYYDPQLARWLTTDPAGFADTTNLYAYLRNNPFRYVDPDGRCAIAIPFLFWGCTGIYIALPSITTLITNTLVAAATWYALDFAYNIAKNTDVYAPDRPLPLTDDGIPIPDTDAPHTQLGTKDSKRRGGKYPQAREFDGNGKPIKTIDFTDHEKPHNHPNPHEHSCDPNSTGGTPKRGDPKPLEHWKY